MRIHEFFTEFLPLGQSEIVRILRCQLPWRSLLSPSMLIVDRFTLEFSEASFSAIGCQMRQLKLAVRKFLNRC